MEGGETEKVNQGSRKDNLGFVERGQQHYCWKLYN